MLFSLSRHHLLLLISIARASRGEQQLYVPFKKIKQIYLTLCEEYGLLARKNTQLWEYLKDLELNGIIALRTTQKGKRGRSTLVSLENIPSDILEREVTNILK